MNEKQTLKILEALTVFHKTIGDPKLSNKILGFGPPRSTWLEVGSDEIPAKSTNGVLKGLLYDECHTNQAAWLKRYGVKLVKR